MALRPQLGQYFVGKAALDPHFIGHALVQCELDTEEGPLTFFGTHYDAHYETLRFVEARYLRSLLVVGATSILRRRAKDGSWLAGLLARMPAGGAVAGWLGVHWNASRSWNDVATWFHGLAASRLAPTPPLQRLSS